MRGQKTMLFASLLAGLAFLTFGAKTSKAIGGTKQSETATADIQFVGELLSHDGKGRLDVPWGRWIGPGLDTGANWFGLDLSKQKKLIETMRLLAGKRVVVIGRPEKRKVKDLQPHLINVIVVSAVEPIIEFQGRLTRKKILWGASTFDQENSFLCVRYWRDTWTITVHGRDYVLEFGSPNLTVRAGQLVGKMIIVSGTRDGTALKVVDLTAAEDKR
jgi:hypothetical protein